jgi:uncharacterized protein YjiS (DUF1127 family)
MIQSPSITNAESKAMTTRTFDLFPARPRADSRAGVLQRFRDAWALARQRRALDALEDHLLDDIGLTRADVAREIARPMWDVPGHWRA